MKFVTSSTAFSEITADLSIVPVFENTDIAKLHPYLRPIVHARIEKEGFTGKKNTSVLVQTDTDFSTVFIVGLGKQEGIKPEDVLQLGAVGVRKAKQLNGTSIVCFLPDEVCTFANGIAHLVTGATLGNYAFTKHKHTSLDKTKKEIETFMLVLQQDNDVGQQIVYGQTLASAVTFARDLINQSPSETPPSRLAEIALELSTTKESISCTVLSKPEMETIGMGGILGIARGSSEEPKFIHLTFNGGGKKVVTIVGKGITFDSGGLSIKSAQGMETMKLDMSGGALVLAVFSVLSHLKPELTVHGLIPATENMVGPHAVKPGDVVTAMNGKTIEILNTDAEGRVVLADAMSYAGANIKSDVIIDFATLTGACMIALGEEIAGLFSNTEELTTALKHSAKNTGEKIWELPLVEEYKEKLKSPVADIKNIGGKYGGAITGALFIEAFVPENTPWAHVDIAGPSYAEKDTPLTPYGGTGFGTRMILEYLMSLT